MSIELVDEARTDSADAGSGQAAGARPSAMSSAPRRMNAFDVRRAAYLAARELDGRPVDDGLKSLLERGDRCKSAILDRFRHGRVNVRTDLEATGNETNLLHCAVREVEDRSVPEARPTDPVLPAQIAHRAKRAELVQMGNCGDFAAATLKEFAGDLRAAESLECRALKDADHVWPELVGHGHRVNLDAWSDGPAIAAEDGRFSGRRKHSVTVFRLGKAASRAFVEASEERSGGIAGLVPQIRDEYAEWLGMHAGHWRPVNLYDPQPVIDRRFAQRMRDRMEPGSATPAPAGGLRRSLKSAKHRLLALARFDSDIRARGREKVRLDKLQAASVRITDEQARTVALRNAARLGVPPDEAAANVDAIVEDIKALDRPMPRGIEAPDIPALLDSIESRGAGGARLPRPETQKPPEGGSGA